MRRKQQAEAREQAAKQPLSSGHPELVPSGTTYKVIETSAVTDDALEQILNEYVAQGWTFEGMQFAMRESSKRPSMAFVLFTKALG